MNDEQLIELVREYSVLYDVSHPKYMDSMFKVGIWKKIASELNEPVAACKARWNNMRDNYRKSLKKTSNRGARGKMIKLYKYSEQLAFLKKFFYERESKGSPEEERDKPDEDSEDYEQVQTPKDEQVEPSVSDANDDTQSQASSTSNCKINSLHRRIPIVRKSPMKRLMMPRRTSSKLVEFLMNKNQPATTHPVDAFLSGIAPTLKALPPYYLGLAKSEIFSAVHKYEMKMIMEQHSYQERLNGNRATSSTLPPPILLPIEQRLQPNSSSPAPNNSNNTPQS